MDLIEAQQWAQRNCTEEAMARLRSRRVVKALSDEIERLRAELEEQCRLNGCGSEREAKLKSENDALRAELEKANRGRELYKDVYDELYDELAALKQQEPVAWMTRDGLYPLITTEQRRTSDVPLYLAPQPAQVPEVVTLQVCDDGVWAHFRVGKGYAYSQNLSCDRMSKRFADEYKAMLAAPQQEGK